MSCLVATRKLRITIATPGSSRLQTPFVPLGFVRAALRFQRLCLNPGDQLAVMRRCGKRVEYAMDLTCRSMMLWQRMFRDATAARLLLVRRRDTTSEPAAPLPRA